MAAEEVPTDGHMLRLSSALAQGMSASAMATLLADAVAVEATARASTTKARLRSGGFDQAPVTHKGLIVGWIRTSSLSGRGSVASAMCPLAECAVLSTATPLTTALPLVVEKGFAFLAGPAGLAAFVVPSDLDRLAVRSFLYLLLAELEIALAHIVRHEVPDNVVEACLGAAQRKRLERARAKGLETHVTEYLYLRDYAALARQSLPLAEMMGSDFNPTIVRDLLDLNVMRNCVAHPSKSLTGTLAPEEVIRRVRLAEDMLTELTTGGRT